LKFNKKLFFMFSKILRRCCLTGMCILFIFQSIGQDSTYQTRLEYVIDQLERIFTYDDMEEIKLSVYFKNEDNGQVNLGYVSPSKLFSIQHNKRFSTDDYEPFCFSTARLFICDTVYYSTKEHQNYASSFVDKKLYTDLEKLTLNQIKAKYLTDDMYKRNDPTINQALECYLDRKLIPSRDNGMYRQIVWKPNTDEFFQGFPIVRQNGEIDLYSYDKKGRILDITRKDW